MSKLRWILVAIAALGIAPAASAQLTVVEPGFIATALPAGSGSMQVECSPGGAWGDFVYVANTQGGTIERIDFADVVTPFAGGFLAPIGLTFGPGPALNFGSFLYVSDRDANATRKVSTGGSVSNHATITSPGGSCFDPTGAYGNALFVPVSPGGPIDRINPSGTVVVTFAQPASYVRFGSGGAWGTGMYVSAGTELRRISIAGVATLLAGGFGDAAGFDWAGGAFGGDLFATDVQTGEVWRVKADGTRSRFATLPGAGDVTYCNGALYVVSTNGGRFRIDESPVPTQPATLGVIKAIYR